MAFHGFLNQLFEAISKRDDLVGIEFDTVAEWAQRRRIDFTTYRDLTEKPEVVALVRCELFQVT